MTGTIDPARFGMPDATTTGVSSGTTLTAYTGPMTITKDGTVIENKIIDGATLRVMGDNVTIKNCVIKNYGMWGIDGEGAANITVQNCDFIASSSQVTNAAILGAGTFVGNDISNSANGIVLLGGASVVRGNYIHNLRSIESDAHIDGISVQGGQDNVLIEHNTIESWDTSCIIIKNDFGPINNIMVRDNLMYGDAVRGDPSATVYVYGPNTTNVTIAKNYVEKGHWFYYSTSNANPTITGNIEWDNKTAAIPYPTSSPTAPTTPAPTAPSAPTIASFLNDSGVAGDGITNGNTITLTGKAAANSTVKVFDGAKQIGTVSAANDGTWSYKSAALPDGAHKFTATATSSGIPSPASAARTVTVDTVAPTAPTIKMSTTAATLASTHVAQLTGTAEANSAVKVFDGSTQIGTATANNSGAWTFTTKSLADGGHNFTAKAMDVAGNTGAASTALAFTIAPSTPTAPATPNAPAISSFSRDSGVVGDHITNDNTLTLTGTAAANSAIKVYDGTRQIGTTTANSSGSWSHTTAALNDAKHTLTATATNSQGKTSSASTNLDVTIDTTAPTAPTIASSSSGTTQSVNARAASSADNVVKLTGTAESKSAIDVFDGSSKIGTATAAADGTWSFTTDQLSTGQHTFTAKATDVAGNIGKTSTVLSVNVSSSAGPAAPPTSTPGKVIESAGATKVFESGEKYYLNSSSGSGPSLKYHGVDFVDGTDGTWAPIAAEKTTTGYQVVWKEGSTGLYTAWNTDNNGNYASHVNTLTGSTSGGSVSGTNSGLKLLETSFHQDLNGDGQIGGSRAAAPTQINSTDKVVPTSGETMVGTDRSDSLTSTIGNDIMVGKGGSDTFVFAPNFGNDVIKDFRASGSGHDKVQFSKSAFDNFADVLAHATQAGGDVVIATDHGDSLTLKNTKLAALDKSDFHFA